MTPEEVAGCTDKTHVRQGQVSACITLEVLLGFAKHANYHLMQQQHHRLPARLGMHMQHTWLATGEADCAVTTRRGPVRVGMSRCVKEVSTPK